MISTPPMHTHPVVLPTQLPTTPRPPHPPILPLKGLFATASTPKGLSGRGGVMLQPPSPTPTTFF